jgi:hypothetical protein
MQLVRVSDPEQERLLRVISFGTTITCSYRNRYLLETGAANPSARTLNTSEEEMER